MRIVLVHGLWHGAWCWQAVSVALARVGVASEAVELPMRTLAGDAALVRAAIGRGAEEVLLVGHSYGGAVITAAGGHPAVRQLVYLAGFALDAEDSISRVAAGAHVAPTGLAAALRVSGDGADIAIDPDRVPDLLYNRTAGAVVEDAITRLRPAGRPLFGARPEAVAWREKPATYVVCTDDRTVAPDLQRIMASRLTTAVTWDSDHSPQASRPDEVAGLLAGLAR